MLRAWVGPLQDQYRAGEGLMRTGTMENPVLVRSAGDEQYAGCTGVPADSHNVIWLGVGFVSATAGVWY